MNAWDLIKRELRQRLSAESYNNWVALTSFVQVDGTVLVVSVPDAAAKQWLESEYGDLIRSLVQGLGLRLTGVRYDITSSQGARIVGPSNMLSEQEFAPIADQLNPKYSFDDFVVGPCNQLAHAAARSVAATPSRSYNPLFIYGGTGMGKTHLMHAIGRELMRNHASMRVIYTSTERFMNEMINSIRHDQMDRFRQFYRTADVLLVDDVQILSEKERTQEEFFHTFNDLHDHQKQIVVSGDSQPKDIPKLVERLRSRFEWGLMVDMQPPDLETKMAILDKKAGMEGIYLPEDVRTFIATRTRSNVRELEGSLVKLIAYSSLTNSPITMQMASQALKHLAHAQERRISIENIQRVVADHFNLKPSQLKEKSNTQAIAYPRQIAMYLAKELTTASLPEIGRAFGGKHHTTVLHSVRKIERERALDPNLNRLIQRLIDSLQ